MKNKKYEKLDNAREFENVNKKIPKCCIYTPLRNWVDERSSQRNSKSKMVDI